MHTVWGERREFASLLTPGASHLQFIGEAYAEVCFIAITFSSCCFSAPLVLSLSSHPCFILFFFFWLGKRKPCECKSLQLDLRSLLCPCLIAEAPMPRKAIPEGMERCLAPRRGAAEGHLQGLGFMAR